MTDPPTNTSSSALGSRRRTALRRALRTDMATSLASRLGFWLGLLVAGWYAAAMVAVRIASSAPTDPLLIQAMHWMSLPMGLTALGLAGKANIERQRGVLLLATQRGHSSTEITAARSFAQVRLLVGTVGVPAGALSLLTLALSRSLSAFLGGLSMVVALTGYIFLVSLVLGVLVRWTSALERRYAVGLLLAAFLLPEVARSARWEVPSLLGVLSELLAQVAHLGAVFS